MLESVTDSERSYTAPNLPICGTGCESRSHETAVSRIFLPVQVARIGNLPDSENNHNPSLPRRPGLRLLVSCQRCTLEFVNLA